MNERGVAMENVSKLFYRWLIVVMVGVVGIFLLSTTGCTGSSKTVTTTVTTQNPDESAVSSSTSSVTTEEEVTTGTRPHGVIGGLFYTIGQVLIWPFKVIGSLF